ncbi:MAG: hypothetical protein GX793_08795 [Bacteroidales bacterium]|jgi:hypothetical protein|nr:Ig-like domain-containing domain [Bacteroidales bacterium]MCK9498210.1 Ig-like domain-containing domain [Bacteroidales bacterium]MDY0313619.1 Ig-like domain-containing domain [Bacteroidales bacterium]NLB87143.1 hypothetical protein [Bacteroidales bacterium]
MKKLNLISFIFAIYIILTIVSCAKQIAISGGPKDTSPPKFVKSMPENGSINFNFDKIIIQFDEYIKLNNINQKLIVSPPMKTKPIITIKRKGILIKLKSKELEQNTTYTLNFNDAIADNNENNSLNSFVFAFSTGDKIDSLYCAGVVLDAFDRKPVKDAWVSLYSDLNDSAIINTTPSYITKTDQNGKFSIPFIKENTYNIYALIDNNYNYLFDLPEESIAFLDSTIQASVKFTPKTDSTEDKVINQVLNLELLIFKEDNQAQFIKSSKRTTPRLVEINFNKAQYDDFEIAVAGDENAIVNMNKDRDSLKIFLTKEEIIDSSKLKLILKYPDFELSNNIIIDTVNLRTADIEIKDNIAKLFLPKTIGTHSNLEIKTDYPIADFDSDKLKLELISEDEYIDTDFELEKDSINPLIIRFKSKLLEKSEYRIIFDSLFLKNIYNETNLADTVNFKTTSSSEYGNFKIIFPETNTNYIVQMIQNEKVIAENKEINKEVEFKFLKAGKYIVKIIEDLNTNARWDTGNYMEKKQAEKVYFLPVEYEIRANWSHEIEWDPITNKFIE